MDREQVEDAINAAFAKLRVPHPRTLIGHRHPPDQPGEEKIRGALAGKDWRSLTSEFVAARWAAFCYLSPAAYRYYLPSLLMGALESFYGERGLTHPAVFALRPSFWSLYYEGDDRDFRDKQSAFTLAQYRAVCMFLGLVFERHPDLSHLAAQALRWGWNRFDTPALEVTQEYYHRLHTFSYPEPDAPERRNLFREIRSAFAATPYPGDDQLCGSAQGDEPAEYAMELRGLTWQSAHPELLAHSYAALSFLSDTGFRYFLPAFLLADLFSDETGDKSAADPVFHLTHGFHDTHDREEIIGREGLETLRQANEHSRSVDWRTYLQGRFAPLSREERIAIIHYLEYRARDEFDAPGITQALDRYWRPSVQGST